MKVRIALSITAATVLGVTGYALAQAQPEDDAAFAAQIWEQLLAQRLVGPESIGAVPYPRQGEAHGSLLVSLLSTITVGETEGQVIVKRSYAGEDATRDNIIANPADNVANITVMFKREGYDPENADWFWAMYMPDGTLGEMEGMPVAGRVEMCTSCHVEAQGGDYLFLQ
jgi:hypothetical protein